MSFRIERQGDELLVRIDGTLLDEKYVIDRVSACRGTSWWSCPSGECSRIGTCDTRRDGDATVIALIPRPGETLSATGVEECLRYVLAEAASADGDPGSRKA